MGFLKKCFLGLTTIVLLTACQPSDDQLAEKRAKEFVQVLSNAQLDKMQEYVFFENKGLSPEDQETLCKILIEVQQNAIRQYIGELKNIQVDSVESVEGETFKIVHMKLLGPTEGSTASQNLKLYKEGDTFKFKIDVE